MTKTEFQEMLVDLMRKGLHIHMFMEKGLLWFDLNTFMKSHLHVKYNEDLQRAEYRARYDATGVITDWDDLMIVVRECDHGRGFANSAWLDILQGDQHGTE